MKQPLWTHPKWRQTSKKGFLMQYCKRRPCHIKLCSWYWGVSALIEDYGDRVRLPTCCLALSIAISNALFLAMSLTFLPWIFTGQGVPSLSSTTWSAVTTSSVAMQLRLPIQCPFDSWMIRTVRSPRQASLSGMRLQWHFSAWARWFRWLVVERTFGLWLWSICSSSASSWPLA